MTRRNIRLVLSYDGTELRGWQRQDEGRSVQGELEAALARMHGRSVSVVGAGRTDAGVHALGQTANFYTDIALIGAERFVPALNGLLPRDIRVRAASAADFDFHSRYDARSRAYRYFATCGSGPDPFRSRFAHHLFRRPDLASLNAMASLILGETDFTAFSSARDASRNRSRFVHESSFRWEGDLLVYQVAANAFLWRMVRSLVGSMLHFEARAAKEAAAAELPGGEGRILARELSRAAMERALASRDRSLAGPTAPARGLFLWNVEYYASPTRPGRGDYWCRAEEDAAEGGAEGDDA